MFDRLIASRNPSAARPLSDPDQRFALPVRLLFFSQPVECLGQQKVRLAILRVQFFRLQKLINCLPDAAQLQERLARQVMRVG